MSEQHSKIRSTLGLFNLKELQISTQKPFAISMPKNLEMTGTWLLEIVNEFGWVMMLGCTGAIISMATNTDQMRRLTQLMTAQQHGEWIRELLLLGVILQATLMLYGALIVGGSTIKRFFKAILIFITRVVACNFFLLIFPTTSVETLQKTLEVAEKNKVWQLEEIIGGPTPLQIIGSLILAFAVLRTLGMPAEIPRMPNDTEEDQLLLSTDGPTP